MCRCFPQSLFSSQVLRCVTRHIYFLIQNLKIDPTISTGPTQKTSALLPSIFTFLIKVRTDRRMEGKSVRERLEKRWQHVRRRKSPDNLRVNEYALIYAIRQKGVVVGLSFETRERIVKVVVGNPPSLHRQHHVLLDNTPGPIHQRLA